MSLVVRLLGHEHFKLISPRSYRDSFDLRCDCAEVVLPARWALGQVSLDGIVDRWVCRCDYDAVGRNSYREKREALALVDAWYFYRQLLGRSAIGHFAHYTWFAVNENEAA